MSPLTRMVLGTSRASRARPPFSPAIRRVHRTSPLRNASILASTTPRSSFYRRVSRTVRSTFKAVVFFALGAFIPVLVFRPGYVTMFMPPSNAETVALYEPADDEAREKEAYLDSHPLVVRLRADPSMSEARWHLKMPQDWRAVSLTSGSLTGHGRMAIPPLGFRSVNDGGHGRFVQVVHAGTQLCGHPGVLHGGFLATLLDEGLWKAAYDPEAGRTRHVTARLEIDYRAPALADQYLVLRAETTAVHGRKAWVEGRIETLPKVEGEEPVVLATATALFVSPKVDLMAMSLVNSLGSLTKPKSP